MFTMARDGSWKTVSQALSAWSENWHRKCRRGADRTALLQPEHQPSVETLRLQGLLLSLISMHPINVIGWNSPCFRVCTEAKRQNTVKFSGWARTSTARASQTNPWRCPYRHEHRPSSQVGTMPSGSERYHIAPTKFAAAERKAGPDAARNAQPVANLEQKHIAKSCWRHIQLPKTNYATYVQNKQETKQSTKQTQHLTYGTPCEPRWETRCDHSATPHDENTQERSRTPRDTKQ